MFSKWIHIENMENNTSIESKTERMQRIYVWVAPHAQIH